MTKEMLNHSAVSAALIFKARQPAASSGTLMVSTNRMLSPTLFLREARRRGSKLVAAIPNMAPNVRPIREYNRMPRGMPPVSAIPSFDKKAAAEPPMIEKEMLAGHPRKAKMLAPNRYIKTVAARPPTIPVIIPCIKVE
jgi:hypothetical protein